MPYTNTEVPLYYEVAGTGRPVVLIHGWPFSSRMWEYQVIDLVDAGFSCITYDRRGFGDSGRPWDGYDYDTLSADLDGLLTELDLTDVGLVGFSMGGGEVARYLGTRGSDRVSRAVLLAAVTPHLYQSEESPHGAPAEVLAGLQDEMVRDRIGFLKDLSVPFFSLGSGAGTSSSAEGDDTPGADLPSESLLAHWLQIQSFASPRATRECAKAYGSTDFTADLRRIDVPTLVIHGDDDQIVPMEATGRRAAEIIPDSRFEVVAGGSHGLWYTQRAEVNRLLIDFLS